MQLKQQKNHVFTDIFITGEQHGGKLSFITQLGDKNSSENGKKNSPVHD
jgi:hypothetical protein